MIKTLYPCFQRWSEKGSVYLISDTHFDDLDRKIMGYTISEEEQFYILKETCHKNDTLIHLGDVGNPEYVRKLPCYCVLVMGNHDNGYTKWHFDETYSGPLWISQKLVLSHEPIIVEDSHFSMPIAFNIHGHDHGKNFWDDQYHLNICQNVYGYMPLNLNQFIKDGYLERIKDIHRLTIDNAIANKDTKSIFHEWYTDTGVENV